MRATPLTKPTARAVSAWIQRRGQDRSAFLFPSARGGRLSADAGQSLVKRHATAAKKAFPSLATKRVTPHVLRHTAAMELLQAGVDRALIAIWLGHESVETTQIYLDANFALKEEILGKTRPIQSRPGRYRLGSPAQLPQRTVNARPCDLKQHLARGRSMLQVTGGFGGSNREYTQSGSWAGTALWRSSLRERRFTISNSRLPRSRLARWPSAAAPGNIATFPANFFDISPRC